MTVLRPTLLPSQFPAAVNSLRNSATLESSPNRSLGGRLGRHGCALRIWGTSYDQRSGEHPRYRRENEVRQSAASARAGLPALFEKQSAPPDVTNKTWRRRRKRRRKRRSHYGRQWRWSAQRAVAIETNKQTASLQSSRRNLRRRHFFSGISLEARGAASGTLGNEVLLTSSSRACTCNWATKSKISIWAFERRRLYHMLSSQHSRVC